MPNRFAVALAISIYSLTLISGCCLRKHGNCCQVSNSLADKKVQLNCVSTGGYVSYNFDKIGDADVGAVSQTAGLLNQESIGLDLHQCCCAAAINSLVADIIDKEREAFCCDHGYNKCVDDFLRGQALQNRNKAASKAGQLFLKLVEVRLQEQLLEQAFEKINELKTASEFVQQQGFATDAADLKIEENEIHLKKQIAELADGRLQLQIKLNLLLGIEICQARTIQPIFDLEPVLEPVDVCAEIETALNNRPDLKGLQDSGCGCFDEECYLILSQLNPGIGIGVATAVKRCLLLKKLCQQNDCGDCARQQQLSRLKSARKELVKQEVIDTVRQMETGYQLLVLEKQELTRLENRTKALELAAELNPMDSFIESIENWATQQRTKSAQITKAIEFEIAKIKLLEVTGQWLDVCGIE